MNARQVAHQYLCRLLLNRQTLSQSLRADDHALTRMLCYGVCRYYWALQQVLDHYVKKKPKSLEAWVALLMGAYQIEVLNKPHYATVKETVGLLDGSRAVYAKGFVNAVLRQLIRDHATHKARFEQAVLHHSAPAWLCQRLQQDWPNEWQAIVHATLAHPPMFLRVNRQQVTREVYMAALAAQGFDATVHPWVESAVVLAEPCAVHVLPGFQQGWVSVQDVSAQLALSCLELQPGMRVLDAAAAPGGKTTHMLEHLPTLQAVVAVEKDAARAEKLHENLKRLHLTATVCLADASKPSQWWDGQPFDRVLLDAPCSATGIIRRHPDVHVLRTTEEVEAICQTQQALLHALWPLLKPGGKLIYVTCAVLRQENDQQIQRFVAHHPDACPQALILPWGRPTAVGWQVLPGEAMGDGFYYAVIERLNKA